MISLIKMARPPRRHRAINRSPDLVSVAYRLALKEANSYGDKDIWAAVLSRR